MVYTGIDAFPFRAICSTEEIPHKWERPKQGEDERRDETRYIMHQGLSRVDTHLFTHSLTTLCMSHRLVRMVRMTDPLVWLRTRPNLRKRMGHTRGCDGWLIFAVLFKQTHAEGSWMTTSPNDSHHAGVEFLLEVRWPSLQIFYSRANWPGVWSKCTQAHGPSRGGLGVLLVFLVRFSGSDRSHLHWINGWMKW